MSLKCYAKVVKFRNEFYFLYAIKIYNKLIKNT